jgi:hypothetical protein
MMIYFTVQQGVGNRRAAGCTFLASQADINILRDAWLQPAARSLEEMYGLSINGSFKTVMNIPAMQKRLDDLGITAVRDVRLEEEQEREVSHEVEQEQQIERPPKVAPAVHQSPQRESSPLCPTWDHLHRVSPIPPSYVSSSF